ncbi:MULTISPECIES: hypothetical protein [Rhodococcus]|uniref:hypothetical protein n=1 Tax=Rhodococcus TaxID=1827 RepID=UPI00177AF740|nr:MULTISPECIES: hypothetical protein [Rhodococcus]QOH55243.1 hypothetical protein C6Y44_04100 [Rhodococcus rhodochrous]BDB58971.1 hypothetical protein RDE2_07650 [Rhodococcus sp. RDE2]
MPRTPEQIAADDALTAAIDRVWAAYSDIEDGVLVDYIVVANRRHWDADGDTATSTFLHNRDDSVPIANQLGLAEFMACRVRKWIAED